MHALQLLKNVNYKYLSSAVPATPPSRRRSARRGTALGRLCDAWAVAGARGDGDRHASAHLRRSPDRRAGPGEDLVFDAVRRRRDAGQGAKPVGRRTGGGTASRATAGGVGGLAHVMTARSWRRSMSILDAFVVGCRVGDGMSRDVALSRRRRRQVSARAVYQQRRVPRGDFCATRTEVCPTRHTHSLERCPCPTAEDGARRGSLAR